MRDENNIVRERQRLIRRQMDARGILIKQVQLDGGWNDPSTVQSYFPASEEKEPATMSVAALYRLLSTKALPADLLSLLMPPGFALVEAPEEIDHDEIERMCREYLAAKGEAHHHLSPAGRDIAECEDQKLRAKAVRLRSVAT